MHLRNKLVHLFPQTHLFHQGYIYIYIYHRFRVKLAQYYVPLVINGEMLKFPETRSIFLVQCNYVQSCLPHESTQSTNLHPALPKGKITCSHINKR